MSRRHARPRTSPPCSPGSIPPTPIQLVRVGWVSIPILRDDMQKVSTLDGGGSGYRDGGLAGFLCHGRNGLGTNTQWAA